MLHPLQVHLPLRVDGVHVRQHRIALSPSQVVLLGNALLVFNSPQRKHVRRSVLRRMQSLHVASLVFHLASRHSTFVKSDSGFHALQREQQRVSLQSVHTRELKQLWCQ